MCEQCGETNKFHLKAMEEAPVRKAVVLLSGGIDSSTLLAAAVAEYGAHNVTALSLIYGQKHAKELQSAEAIAAYYCVRHVVEDLGLVFRFSDSPLLSRSSQEVPDGSYADDITHEADGISKTYVPYRNGLLLSYAAAIAYSIGADEIHYGAHADDAAGNAYPDCTPQFYSAQAQAVFEGTGKKVNMVAPLINMFKKDVVAWGLELGVPYEKTWSCYNGSDKPCGTCGTCVDRRIAFYANGTQDPLKYAGALQPTEGVIKTLESLGLEPWDYVTLQTHSE